jgi:hypothetical protein
MAGKKKAAGALAAAEAARSNPYVRRLIEDKGLRDDLRGAYTSARKAYGRMNGKGPQKALSDKKLQRELKTAAESLKSASDSLRKKKRGKRGRLALLGIAVVGAGLAVGLNEGLRKKVLDGLFGKEEEFEYTSTTTPGRQPVGAA